jgi:hypothetical protein
MTSVRRTATLAALVACSAHAAPILQPNDWAYVLDTFSNETTSAQIWAYASCTDTPYGTVDANRPNLRFLTFGQASRPGLCDFRTEGTNKFMRFITMPFDRRDAEESEDNYCKADGTVNTVDERKGGSEMRSDEFHDYLYDGVVKTRGWDTFGRHYLTSTNTVRFSWRFRLLNVSMLKGMSNGEKLATSAVVGQFHSQTNPNDPDHCKAVESSFSPAPGLDVSVGKALDGTEQVFFKLFTMLRNSQIPAGQPRCAGDDNTICNTTLWQQGFPISQVTRVDSSDTHMPPWISVNYVMRSSKNNGALKFAFGVDGSSDNNLKLQNRLLNGANTSSYVLHIPTTQNECPNRPFLGSYVLGYNFKYYGGASRDKRCYAKGDASLIRPDHLPTPSTWVHPDFFKDARLKSYYDGTWVDGNTPPQFIVDFDDFRIVQVPSLP